MFVLTRHAHAGIKRLWTGPDADRPLSPLGRHQAHQLVTALADVPLRTLLSSPTSRCRQTLTPLAEARGLAVADEPMLAPDAPVADLFAYLYDKRPDGVLLCTHGEVLTALAGLARTTQLGPTPPPGGTEKGGAWIVDPAAPVTHQLRYLPAVPHPRSEGTDFGPVRIRPLTAADHHRVRALRERSTERDIHSRAAEPTDSDPATTAHVCRQDERHGAVGAFAGDTVLGLANYRVVDSPAAGGPVADCAVVVGPEAQRHGIGTALVHRLTELAAARGVTRLTAAVPRDNQVMLDILDTLQWCRNPRPHRSAVEMSTHTRGSAPPAR